MVDNKYFANSKWICFDCIFAFWNNISSYNHAGLPSGRRLQCITELSTGHSFPNFSVCAMCASIAFDSILTFDYYVNPDQAQFTPSKQVKLFPNLTHKRNKIMSCYCKAMFGFRQRSLLFHIPSGCASAWRRPRARAHHRSRLLRLLTWSGKLQGPATLSTAMICGRCTS